MKSSQKSSGGGGWEWNKRKKNLCVFVLDRVSDAFCLQKSPVSKQYILEWHSWNSFTCPLESLGSPIHQESVCSWEEKFLREFVWEIFKGSTEKRSEQAEKSNVQYVVSALLSHAPSLPTESIHPLNPHGPPTVILGSKADDSLQHVCVHFCYYGRSPELE